MTGPIRRSNAMDRYEYPDAAGYPDGTGFLDEGTATVLDGDDVEPLRDIDTPSADAVSEVDVRRDDAHRIYAATLGRRQIADLRYDEVEGRVVVLKTTVVAEFRGRGIAEQLAAYALDDIRERGMHVTVYCPFVTTFMKGNRQFADLLDPQYPGR
jgi:predicted GNAT family acetyltransferase